MELKDILKRFREENGLSQRELARRCELSNSLISILEMGVNPQTGKKASPDLVTYRKLASGMGIPAQTLFEMLDETELVSLSYSDFERALGLDDEKPKNDDIRFLIRGLNKMPPEQLEKAKSMMEIMFDKYFGKEGDDETGL